MRGRGAMSLSIADVLNRLARLDARAKAAPGQLGFDLTGNSSTSSGGGTKCGDSFIAPSKTCRKEGGGQPETGNKPYRPTPQVKAGVSAKPMTFNAGGDSSYDPAAEKKQAAGGLKYYRTQRGGQSKQNYFFRDRQAAEHWYADSNAKSDADIEVGTANRRGKEWQAEYRASYEGTRNMLRDVGDRELLDTVEAYAAAGSATSRGTATDVRISGNPHSRPIREGTFGKQAATTKRPSLEEAIASQIQAGAEGRDAIIAELKTYGVELSQEEADEILSSDLADMLEAQHMIAAQKKRQAQGSSSVLSNPGRLDPGLAPKAKPEGLSATEAVTSKQQAQLARQQQAAAKAAGDKRGAEAWREQERRVERSRLHTALQGQSQSQTSLFGVTEYDETMPLFGRRNDSADNTSRLIAQVLSEYLPRPQVIEWDTSRGSTHGRVVSEGLLYAFRCDGDSVGYRPAWDCINERQWELRSDGFLQARYPETRLDFRFQQQRSKRKCSKGYGCGSACISMQKECRVQAKSAISKARLKALQALATEGDAGAAQKARDVQMQREATAQKLKGDRQVGKLKKMLEDPRIAELVRTGRLPEGESRGGDAPPKPGDVRNVSPDGIEVDPDRFQYKIGASASGEVGSLSGVRRWDPNLAGVVSVWQDPADGKTYVVNGHNRLGLARRLGAEQVTVRYLDAPDAKTARAIGAKQNIAEGAGTEVDAAKFFRDTGIKSMQQVEEQGLPLRSGKAEKGLALARLPEEMFQDVVQGRLRMRQAALIGASGLDEDKQREVYKVVKKNPKIQDETLGEYVEQLAFSQRQTQTTMDLFGAGEESVDTGLARADLTKSIKKTLSQEARLLASVSKSQKAVDILQEKGGNVINVGQSQEKAGEANTVLRLFDQLKLTTGPVKAALDQAAARITNGESRSAVMKDLREQVVDGLDEELRRLGLKDDEPRRNKAESMSMFDSADRFALVITRMDAIKRKCKTGYAGRTDGWRRLMQRAYSARMDRRCARPDGTFYGTKGECRKGKPAGTRQNSSRSKKGVAAPKANAAEPAKPGGAKTKRKAAEVKHRPRPKSAVAKTTLTPMSPAAIKKAFEGLENEWLPDAMQKVLGRIYAARGYNAKPSIAASEDELRRRTDTIRNEGEEEGLVAYRGVTEAKYVEQFMGQGPDGSTHFPGLGVTGNGTYAAAPRDKGSPEKRKANSVKALNTARAYAGVDRREVKANPTAGIERVLAISIRSDANVLRNVGQEGISKLTQQASEIAGFRIQDAGIAAAILGYDAYEMATTANESYWVMLNRGALIVSSAGQK